MSKLEEYRLSKNIPRWKIAKELEVSENTIFKWENGISEPTEENQLKIDKLLKGERKVK